MQVADLKAVKAERDKEKVDHALSKLSDGAAGADNLIPLICTAVEAYATVGEISNTLRKSFGKFRPVATL